MIRRLFMKPVFSFMNRVLWLVVGAPPLLVACGGGGPAAPPPILQETPADEVLRIAERWTSVTQQRGLLSPPSPISVFTIQEESRIELSPTSAREELVIDETLEMRTGGTIHCQIQLAHPLGLKWGRRDGEAAVELRRPGLQATRVCEGGSHPEPQFERLGGPTRFVLRSDSLVAVDPPRDGRTYLPLP